ncbi:MAG: hypothetical protein GF372_05155 [Candidatus Marinimicrobia bacterium]|nr:hypothetical protein [Candidatus Neomarinimicrobiota bacterium]
MYKMTSPIEDKDITIIKLDDYVDISDIIAVEEVLNSNLTKNNKRILVDFSGMVSISYPAIERLSNNLNQRIRVVNCEPTLFNQLYRYNSATLKTETVKNLKTKFTELI